MKDEIISVERLKSANLSFGDTLMTALGVLKARFGAVLLLMVMFYLPAAAVRQLCLNQVEWVTDPEAMLTALSPYMLWTVVLMFFTALAGLVATHLAASELGAARRFGFSELLSISLRATLREWLTLALLMTYPILFILVLSLLSTVLGSANLFLLLPVMLLLLLFFGFFKETATAMTALSIFCGYRVVAVVRQLFPGRELWKGVFRYLGFYAMSMLPSTLLGFLLSVLLGRIPENLRIVSTILSVAAETVLSLFTVFVTLAMAVTVWNRRLMYGGSKKEENDAETETNS